MSAQYLSVGKQILRRGEAFVIARLLPNHQAKLEHAITGEETTVDLNDLIADLYDGFMIFVEEGKHVRQRKGQSAPEVKYLDPDDCAQDLKNIARFRLHVIEPLLDLEMRTRQTVENRVREVNTALETRELDMPGTHQVSVTRTYQWIADYERSGRDWRALIPNFDERGGKGKWRVPPEVDAIINAVIEDKYARREKTCVEDLLREVAARLDDENRLRAKQDRLDCPARDTLQRRIDALDIKAVFIAKHGKHAAEREFSQFGAGPQVESPLERVEIDHTKLDLIVIDDKDNLPLGRATLTDCMDIATRYPLGYYLGFEPPSYYAVMECLYHAICPKENVQKYGTQHNWIAYGIPFTLVTDNGKEFVGRSLQDACLALNITLEQMPIKKPHYKGKIERLFGTITTVVHGIPGTTFSNTAQRSDYDSVGQACVYLGEAEAILNHFLVDIYAERMHKGLGGVPARRWEQALQNGFLPRLPASAEELAILLGQVDWRTIQPYGIDFESIRYNSPDLALLRNALSKGEKAKIKFHPGDLSRIYVYNPLDGQYILAPALNQEYTRDLSLWKHRVIRRFVLSQQDTVDLAALGRAKRAIQDIVDQARSRKRTSTRAHIARWDSSGQPASLADRQATPLSLPLQPAGEQLPSLPLDTGPQASLANEGWEITYNLPRSQDDLPSPRRKP